MHPERLARTLARLAVREQGKAAPAPSPVRQKLVEGDMLFLENGAKSRFVRVEQLVCLCGAGDDAEVVTADGLRTLSPRLLKEWEPRFPVRTFARIHRSALVNLTFVERVDRGLGEAGRGSCAASRSRCRSAGVTRLCSASALDSRSPPDFRAGRVSRSDLSLS